MFAKTRRRSPPSSKADAPVRQWTAAWIARGARSSTTCSRATRSLRRRRGGATPPPRGFRPPRPERGSAQALARLAARLQRALQERDELVPRVAGGPFPVGGGIGEVEEGVARVRVAMELVSLAVAVELGGDPVHVLQ